MLMELGKETNEILEKDWAFNEVGDFYMKVHGFKDDGLVGGILSGG